MDDFQQILNLLDRARRPADVFGALTGSTDDQLAEANRIRRQFLKVIAPDRNGNSPASVAAFRLLDQFWQQLNQELSAETITVTSRQRAYAVGSQLAAGDEADIFRCTFPLNGRDVAGLLKVSRSPDNNDLLASEADSLQRLAGPGHHTAEQYQPYLPQFVESFNYREPGGPSLRANAFSTDGDFHPDGLYTLEDIRAAYPRGVHPKDMAWMWRRLLYVLGFAHERGIVHGAVLPPHILIHPEGHGLILLDWCYSVRDARTTGAHIPAIVGRYRDWYPPEVLQKQRARSGLDLTMAARCMVWLMGGDPLRPTLPRYTGGTERQPMPPALQAFFRGCVAPPRLQPHAWRLGTEFQDLAVQLWGPRRFRSFHMPKR